MNTEEQDPTQVHDQIAEIFDSLSSVATAVKSKLVVFVSLGVIAAGFLAFSVYSSESSLWWNVVKCGFVFLPALIWLLIWWLLGRVQQAPELASSLIADDEGVLANVQSLSVQKPTGMRSLYHSLRAFRREEGFEVIMETIGGITLLVNPLFVMLALICAVIIILLIPIALAVMLL